MVPRTTNSPPSFWLGGLLGVIWLQGPHNQLELLIPGDAIASPLPCLFGCFGFVDSAS